MARLAPEEGFAAVKSRVTEAVQELFPIKGNKHTLRLDDIEVKDNKDIEDLRSQKKAKLEGRTWAVPVNANLALVDNTTGKVIDRKKKRIMSLPKVTNRHSYIVDGDEYQMDNQWQLKPGVYSRRNDQGELESMFNLKGRSAFKVQFDPKTQKFAMKKDSSHIPLYPIMREMGVSDEELKKSWGSQIFEANKIKSEAAISRFHRAVTKEKGADPEAAKEFLHRFMDGAKMDPDVARLTLGDAHDTVGGKTMRLASEKLLGISRGDVKADARDSLMFKNFRSVEDFAAESIKDRSKEIFRRIGNNLDRKSDLHEIVSADILNRPIHTMISKATLSNRPSQTNPLEMLSGAMKTTIMGEGGIKSEHKITEDAKLIDPSHLGFLDPIHSPEGPKTGVTLHLPLGATKKGNKVMVKMWNTKTKKMEDVDPEKAYNSNIVLPDQVKWKDGKPVPLHAKLKMSGSENDVVEGDLKQADYVMASSAQLFSVASNMIPFMQNDSGNRSTMAGRHMEQAIPLKHREAPLVQTVIQQGQRSSSLNDFMGRVNSHHAPVTGEVVQIKKDGIVVKGADGKKKEVQTYDHFPLNDDKGFIHSTPIVKVGDKVKKGQTVSDTNFTKGGKLALGVNLRSAYVPFHGYNFEDGTVISETGAKKLTSEHMHRKGLDTSREHTLNKEKFLAYEAANITKEQAEKLDDGAVIKKGQKVKPGDILVGALRKREETDEAKIKARMHKVLVKPYDNVSVTWGADHPGVVANVVKRGRRTEVHVRTEEPAEVGDKLCFTEDTEVLTKDGWKCVADITLNDVCYTIKGDLIELQEVAETHHYPVAGELYELASQQVDLRVSSNHSLYVKLRDRNEFALVVARDVIGKRVRHRKNGVWLADTPTEFILPRVEAKEYGKGAHKQQSAASRFSSIPIRPWLTFLGIYLANGYYTIRERKDRPGSIEYRTIICTVEGQQHSVSRDRYSWICGVLDECGFHYIRRDDGLIISSKQLAIYVSQFGHAKDKFIPRECFTWGNNAARWLLEGLTGCDGSEFSSLSYTTISHQLADDVQQLALHRGWAANIKQRQPSNPKWSLRYDVRMVRSKCEPQINHGHAGTQHAQSERLYHSDEPVIGITVPNGTLYVRVNGKTVWTGNSGRHGNKAIIVKVVPDHEMPQTKDGKPTEILLNPLGIGGRLNLGQVLETSAAKIAEKTGKTYNTQNFDGTEDVTAKVMKELKAAGIEDKEELIDSKTGKSMGKALVGPQYVHKLEHQVSKKLVARAGGPGYAYDANRIPKGGGPHGAQALDALGVYALLAHGSKANLRDMQTYKSDAGNNDTLWAAIQSGSPLPPPRPTFAYEKFSGMMRTMGVNMTKQGNSLNLLPLTDKQTRDMSNGALKDAGKMVLGKNLKEEKGGIFDKQVTGGLNGTKWGHIELPESMPNPVFEKSIVALTGMKKKDFSELMAGTKAIDPKTGKWVDPENGISCGKAVSHLLKKIDVKKELASSLKELEKPSLKGARLDGVNKKVKYLQSLDKLGMSPTEAYMQKTIAVMPPSMRPLAVRPSGDLISDDLNGMYKGIGTAVLKLKNANPLLPDDMLNNRREALYDGMKSLAGLGGHLNREYRGVLDIIHGKSLIKDTKGEKGGSPREGFFQSKLIKRKQDLSMRSTIIPEPELGLDEVGIPKKAAMEIYKPFIVKELRGMTGMTPLAARKAVEGGDALAGRALERVIDQRPVLLKRDPVLHKYGIQAFKPQIVSGKTVKIHPLVTSGFGADFDGDDQINTVVTCIPCELYNSDIRWEYRRCEMSARFKEAIGYVREDSGGVFVICNLEDFPREKKIKTKGHIDFWSVPAGVKVVALDEKTNMPVLADVSCWSLHRARKVEIIELGSGRQIVTDDDERAVYGVDASSLQWCRRRPSEAANQFVPVLDEAPQFEPIKNDLSLPSDPRLLDKAVLDERFGYFLGALVGDGWAAHAYGDPKSINFSSSYDEVCDAWSQSLLSMFKEMPTITDTWLEKDKLEGSGGSGRLTVACTAAAEFLVPIIGHGAQNKHLPPFFVSAPLPFLKGLMAGLIDTDGSMSWSSGKDKPQFMCGYQSSSLRLLQEIQHALRMIDISASITPSKTPKGKPFWALTISTVDLFKFGGFPVHHAKKKALQQKFLTGPAPNNRMAYSRYRLIPLPSALAKELRTIIGFKEHRGLYSTVSYAVSRQYVSKETAKIAVKMVGERCTHPLYQRWKDLVLEESFHFERVKDFTTTEIEEDGYDLTVPGYETFMSLDGVILSNTMSAFVPLSTEAVEEAKKMYPSRNLFSPASGKIMYAPTHESQLGIHMLTQKGKDVNKAFKTQADAAKAAEAGKIGMTDVVKIGDRRTTMGRTLVAQALPEKMRADVLSGKSDLDGNGQQEMLSRLAKDHKNDYGDSVNRIKDLGNTFVTSAGVSIGLEDLKVDKTARTRILKAADAKAALIMKGGGTKEEKQKKTVQIYDKATSSMIGAIERTHGVKGKMLHKMMKAGVKPGMAAYRQITMAPMLMMNAKGEVIPTPVRKSYSEGLDVGDYWTSMSGARKGVIQKVQSVQEPGYLTKQVMNSTMNNSIGAPDCGTAKGISLPIDERDILDRYLASDIKSGRKVFKAGTLITPGVRDSLRNNRVGKAVVRSPLRCEHETGICSKSMYSATSVEVRNPSGVEYHTRLSDLFDVIDKETELREGVEIKHCSGWGIRDDVGWTNLEHVLRHPREYFKRLLEIQTTFGTSQIVTEDHTVIVERPTMCDCGCLRIFVDSRSPEDRCYLKCRSCNKRWTINRVDWELGEELEVQAQEVLPGDRIKVPCVLVRSGADSDIDPYFLGIYLAEGSTDRTSGNPRKVFIAQLDNRWRSKMISHCHRVTLNKVSVVKTGISISDTFLVQELVNVLGSLSTAADKKLGRCWCGYSNAYMASILSGLIDGDGHIRERDNGSNEASVGSTSYILLVQMQTWLRKIGTRAALLCRTQKPSGVIKSRKDFFHLTFSIGEELSKLLKDCQKAQGIRPIQGGGKYDLKKNYAVVLKIRDVSDKIQSEWVYDTRTFSRRFLANGMLTHNCFGLDEDGQNPPVGRNVGVISAQAIGERATQLAMQSFHCLHEHSIVLIKKGNEILHTTLGRIYQDGKLDGAQVWDIGGWTDVESVDRHIQHPGTAMVMVRSRSGFSSVSQDNHPHMLRENEAYCPDCSTIPKKMKGGYHCRKCGRPWKGEIVDDAPTMMVSPQEIDHLSHRATLDLGPASTVQRPILQDGWLAGIYCAEGYGCVAVRDQNGGPYVTGIGISQKQGEIYEKIATALEREVGKCARGLRGPRVYSKEMGNKFMSCFGRYSSNVGLPPGWSGYPREWLLDFVAAFIDGDVTTRARKESRWCSVCIDTTSYLAAQQIHWILRREGIQAHVLLSSWREASLHQGIQVTATITEELKELLPGVKKLDVPGKPSYSAEGFSDVVSYIKPFRFSSPPYVYDVKTRSGTFFVDGLLTHNSGGVAPVGRVGRQKAVITDEFNRVQQLVQMYAKIPGSATLSTVGGKISKVQKDPAGGHNVFVGSTRHYVPQNRGEPLVSIGNKTKKLKAGMQIQRGTPLSAGPINPNELLPLAGINKVQGYLTGELYGLYKGQGIRRRNIETVVKSMTNLTKVSDPGDHSEFIRGDFAPTSKVQALNKRLVAKKRKPISHRPVLKGVKTLPLDIQTDWVARLNHEKLGATIIDAANQGWSSDIHAVHPIPALVYGAEFGKGKKPGKY
ncbi:MAG: hypothetical protein KAY24_20105 [Candidatus Eisenbacteria sp.]|nr:hypothetical protein [Candidatus Eisenbacteria bacterium]